MTLKKIYPFLILVVFSIMFYLLNVYTHIGSDDFIFKFIFQNVPSSIMGNRVKNLADMFHSMLVHYNIGSGRITTHSLIQLFLIPENKLYFNIANTIVLVFLTIVVYKFSGKRLRDVETKDFLFIILSFWFFIPGPNHSLLWLTGSIAYLWAISIVLLFLWLYQKLLTIKRTVNNYFLPLIFLFGFLCGLTHEIIVLGVSGALFLVHIFRIRSLKPDVKVLIIGFLSGTLVLILSPGNFSRFSNESTIHGGIFQLILQRGGIVLNIKFYIITVFLVFIMVLLKIFKPQLLRIFIKEQKVFLLSILISFIFILLIGNYEPRIFIGITVFSIVLAFNLFLKVNSKFNPLLVSFLTFLSVVMIFEWIHVFNDLKFNYREFKKNELLWIKNDQNIFPLPESRKNKFVVPYQLKVDKDHIHNVAFSKYYQKDAVVFLPGNLYYNLSTRNFDTIRNISIEYKKEELVTRPKMMFFDESSGYYIIPIENNNIPIEKGMVIYQFKEKIPVPISSVKKFLYDKILKKKLPTITQLSTDYYVLSCHPNNYLIFKDFSGNSIGKISNIELLAKKDN